jgi:hypothetical protein
MGKIQVVQMIKFKLLIIPFFIHSTLIAGSLEQWLEFKKEIDTNDSLKRHYDFGKAEMSSFMVPCLKSVKKLKYIDFNQRAGEPFAEELSVVDGRFSGKKAIALNLCSLRGLPFNPSENGFTVECWIKINGQGGILDKSGKKSGTIIAVGNGWNDGWRLTSKESEVSFSLGNPSSRMILKGRIKNGEWHFIAASWDGKEKMKLFLNGSLVASGKFKDYIRPKRKRMIIGYDKGHGIGSLDMTVDEIILYDRALGEELIMKHNKLKAK